MFHADLDQLTDLLDDLARGDNGLEQVTTELARDLTRLHERWNGSAADANVAMWNQVS